MPPLVPSPRAAGAVEQDDAQRLVIPAAAALCLKAAWLLSFAVCSSLRLEVGLPLAVAALVMGVRALGPGAQRAVIVPRSAALLAVAAMAVLPAVLPAPDAATLGYTTLARWQALCAPPLAGIALGCRPRARRAAFFALMLWATLVLVATPGGVPEPEIDVWAWTQHCARQLLQGAHPYAVAAPDIYRGGFDFGYRASAYHYLPADILAAVPGVALLGDYRYVLAALWITSALLVRAMARRAGWPAWAADAVALLLALHPRAGWFVAHGWTEPFLVAAATGFAWFEARDPGGVPATTLLLLLPALKQYAVIPGLLLLANRPRRWPLAIGLVVSLMTAVPFLLWNARATLEGTLFVVRDPPFRADSLSLTALVDYLSGGWHWGKHVAMAAQLLVGAAAFAVLRRRHPGERLPGGALLLCTALALHVCFLLAPQAFPNYYAMVGALFLLAGVSLGTPLAADERGGAAESCGASSVGSAVARGLAAALVVVVLCAVPYMGWFTLFCGPGNAARRAAANPEEPIGGSLSYAVARDDEQVVRCESRHCPELPRPGGVVTVPIACHPDVACYCVPAAASPDDAARLVGDGARCERPRGRACPPDRCARHLAPANR